ncbi:hypothetical protein BS78_01G284300 [Paspalum vaginatum]|nr:hypothetical protein BS78_01G284300 [Paspalum vaginatum]
MGRTCHQRCSDKDCRITVEFDRRRLQAAGPTGGGSTRRLRAAAPSGVGSGRRLIPAAGLGGGSYRRRLDTGEIRDFDRSSGSAAQQIAPCVHIGSTVSFGRRFRPVITMQ